MIKEIKPRYVKLLCWFEECSNSYVQLILNPEGIGFPNKQYPKTLIDCTYLQIQISKLGQFLIEHTKNNIWRSRELFSDELCKISVGYTPLLLDIDKDYKYNNQTLETVQILTFRCLDLIEKNAQSLKLDDLRVVFSGRKGFHIEARPIEPVDNRYFRKYVLCELNMTDIKPQCNKNIFENGTIDSVGDFVRVTSSYNSWIEDDVVKKRKVLQYTIDEFRKSQIEDIITRSEAT